MSWKYSYRMAYAPPLHERVLVGDLSETEYNDTSPNCHSMQPTTYKVWIEDHMKLAMQAVVSKGIRTAAEIYQVPKSMLGDCISGQVLPGVCSGPTVNFEDSCYTCL